MGRKSRSPVNSKSHGLSSVSNRKTDTRVAQSKADATRKVMQANRGVNTLPEIRLRKLVHQSGLRYAIDVRPERDLNRRADLLFRNAKVAVFVHGCFWHGCPRHYRTPKTNVVFWQTKIDRNKARDRETKSILRKRGWKVIEIWEHQSSEAGARLICKAVRERVRECKH